ANQGEIDHQISEGKQVSRDRLDDADLLDAANVADFPVPLRTLGMVVVTLHARLAHDHGCDQADTVGEDGSEGGAHLSVWVRSQCCERIGLELVELMWRSILEWIVRDESVGDVVLLFVDHATKLKRQGRRDWDRAWNIPIVVHHSRGTGCRLNSGDDIAGIVATHTGDEGINVAGLATERQVRHVPQVQPHDDRQAREQDDHHGAEDGPSQRRRFRNATHRLPAGFPWRAALAACSYTRAQRDGGETEVREG